MTDIELKKWVAKFVSQHKRYGKPFSAKKYDEIRVILIERTKKIDEFKENVSVYERMYWVLHDMYNFNKCPICNNNC